MASSEKSVSTYELRSTIRFFTLKGKNATEIHRELVAVYGEKCMSLQMVRSWRKKFAEGRTNVHDAQRSGRPSTARTQDIVVIVENIIAKNRRFTLDDILDNLPAGVNIFGQNHQF